MYYMFIVPVFAPPHTPDIYSSTILGSQPPLPGVPGLPPDVLHPPLPSPHYWTWHPDHHPSRGHQARGAEGAQDPFRGLAGGGQAGEGGDGGHQDARTAFQGEGRGKDGDEESCDRGHKLGRK